MNKSPRHWVAATLDGLDGLEFRDVEVPDPSPGEVQIAPRAIGVNPIDVKILRRFTEADLPVPVGHEMAGVVTAVAADTEIATGPVRVGDAVIAHPAPGAYATLVNVRASDVFAKPDALPFEQAASLLLGGGTADEMLARVDARPGETVLLHGASGSVGASVLQQARRLGVRVIGTASDRGAETVRRYGGTPVAYGPGLVDRVRALAPNGVDAALDAAGTDEAIDASFELAADRDRVVTIVRHDLGMQGRIRLLSGSNPDSIEFRMPRRASIVDLAAAGELEVPISRTLPLSEAREALGLVLSGKAGGKVVLVP